MHPKSHSFGGSAFENVTEIPCDSADHLLPIDQPTQKDGHGDKTKPTLKQSFIDFLYPGSLQPGQNNYDISFQASFMEEHESAFKKQVKNLIESSLKNIQSNQINFSTEGLFQEELNFQQFQSFEGIHAIIQGKSQFLQKIKKEEKIVQLFKFICKEVPTKIVSQLLVLSSMAFQICQKHLQKNYMFSSEYDIMNAVKQYMDKEIQTLYSDQRINFLSLRKVLKNQLKPDCTVKKSFFDFAEFYISTVILILQSYFVNPYNDGEESRRMKGFRLQELFSENDGENNETSSTSSIQFGLPKKRMH